MLGATSVSRNDARAAGVSLDAGSPLRTSATKPASPSPHVPVVIPANKPKGDLPPRIELKPLPPV